jgi:hypothetical protein
MRKLLELLARKEELSGLETPMSTRVKLWAVEIASTIVFVVFIAVESIKTIMQLIGSLQN